jgi:TetR/AcrR family transcriptional repressor of nem operon
LRYSVAETAQKHQRILDEATRLFREQGFYGVSVGEIMKAAELTHGSFYNHFASKEVLMAEAIEHGIPRLEHRLSAIAPSAEGKRDYISWYLSAQHRDNPGSGCPMSSLAAEVARHSDVKPSMTQYVRAYFNNLAQHFPWRSKRHARRDAILTTAALVGAIVLARSVDDISLSDEIMNSVSADLMDRFC